MKKENAFHFTVKELIEVLEKFPQNLPVLTSGYENGFENIQAPKTGKLKYKPQNPFWDGEFQPAEERDSDILEAVLIQRVKRD